MAKYITWNPNQGKKKINIQISMQWNICRDDLKQLPVTHTVTQSSLDDETKIYDPLCEISCPDLFYPPSISAFVQIVYICCSVRFFIFFYYFYFYFGKTSATLIAIKLKNNEEMLNSFMLCCAFSCVCMRPPRMDGTENIDISFYVPNTAHKIYFLQDE